MVKQDPTKPPQVPGQFLGYSLQTTECLRQLLIAGPGTVISVEVFEDVGVQSPEGSATAIQTKSALTGNPIADRSEELWKAIANWARACENKQLDCDKCTFQIHVFSPKIGPLAEQFAKAGTRNESIAAIEAARNELWGPAPSYPKAASVAATLRPHLHKVFTADPELMAKIIQRFALSFGSGSSRDDLIQILKTKLVPQEFLDHVLDKCLGCVKRRIETAIEKGDTPAIPVDDFQAEVNVFLNKLRLETILNDFAGQPSAAEVEHHVVKQYVTQLRIIDADDDEVLRAINSYLRAATNRAEWSRLFLVCADSFDEYEKALTTFWKNTT